MQHRIAITSCGLALAGLLTTGVSADVTGPNGRTIDCYCTDRTGGRIELGQTICMQVDGRMFMAQCQMSLNVPMWREVAEGCLSSALPQSLQPAVDPLGVDG
ncbi:hypothetical protein [Pseudaestuariivita atlantica]|uniref:Uncharacterized protein n=1 Tax=Pseudaestuariivita atlantica TaxID=1317121 RepID=A0A0L1JKT6_9RHOB|nr:hypothetical protein [Pseudaestuariivita atlantica]KNG92366.1 hypothetical protein ATO11_17275 [Pseudaestuariivita atlantica]